MPNTNRYAIKKKVINLTKKVDDLKKIFISKYGSQKYVAKILIFV